MYVSDTLSWVPIVGTLYNCSGLKDYTKSVEQAARRNNKASAVSFAKGVVKSSLTLMVISWLLKPVHFFSDEETKVKDFNEPFKRDLLSQAFQKKQFKKGSNVHKMATFCLHFFNESFMSNRALVDKCLIPLKKKNNDPFKQWLLENSEEAARRLSRTAVSYGISDMKPLGDCKNKSQPMLNVSQEVLKTDEGDINTHNNSFLGSTCDQNRALYLKKLLEIGDPLQAKKMLNRSCVSKIFNTDLCSQ